MNRPKMHFVKNMCFTNLFFPKEKCTKQNAFFQNGLSSFLDCVFYHLRDAQKNLSPGAHFRFHFEDQGGPFREGRCCLRLRKECHEVSNDVLNDVRSARKTKHTSLLATWSPNVVRHHLAFRAEPLQPTLRCRLRQAQRGVRSSCCPCHSCADRQFSL